MRGLEGVILERRGMVGGPEDDGVAFQEGVRVAKAAVDSGQMTGPLTHHPATPQIPSRKTGSRQAELVGAQNDRAAAAPPKIPSRQALVPRTGVVGAQNDTLRKDSRG